MYFMAFVDEQPRSSSCLEGVPNLRPHLSPRSWSPTDSGVQFRGLREITRSMTIEYDYYATIRLRE